MMKKVVSLLLALVMAVGLCTSAIAETNGESEDVHTGNETYTMETVLAGGERISEKVLCGRKRQQYELCRNQ